MQELILWPLDPPTWILFVVWLATPLIEGGLELAPGTVRSYASSVSSVLLQHGITTHRPTDLVWTSFFQRVLKGITISFADRGRAPGGVFTIPLLARVTEWLLLNRFSTSPLHTRAMVAVVLCQFFGIFRISELVWAPRSTRGIRLADVWAILSADDMADWTNPVFFSHDGAFLLSVDGSKTDVAARGIFKPIASFSAGDPLCPASALAAYARLRLLSFPPALHPDLWQQDSAFFLSTPGCAFTVELFRVDLHAALVGSGSSPEQAATFTSHALRRGGASALALVPDAQAAVHALGGWSQANTVNRFYNRPSIDTLIAAQRAMRLVPAAGPSPPARPPPRARGLAYASPPVANSSHAGRPAPSNLRDTFPF